MTSQMPILMRAMKVDVSTDHAGLVRDLYALPTPGVTLGGSDRAYFRYNQSEHDQLLEKLNALTRAGFLIDTTVNRSAPRYAMTEEFVARLREWRE